MHYVAIKSQLPIVFVANEDYWFVGIITMNIVYNQGFFPMRNYHHILFIKGKEYNFDIVTTDTFLGITVGYFHWPFGYKRKMKKMKENQDTL